MNRADLQQLADTRIREAKTLFEAGEFSGAYYLAGYAIECALKACFAKQIAQYDFPERDDARRVFTHKLPELLRLARLETAFAEARKADPKLAVFWNLAESWSEESRYAHWSRDQASDLLEAIGGKDGMLPWIKQLW